LEDQRRWQRVALDRTVDPALGLVSRRRLGHGAGSSGARTAKHSFAAL